MQCIFLQMQSIARTYRKNTRRTGEASFQVVLEESDLWVTCALGFPPELPALVLEKLRELRGQISTWAKLNPLFLSSLSPLPPSPTDAQAPEIVQKMLAGSSTAGVGPMAAVAGAVAEYIAKFCLDFSQEVLVENGGDIYIFSNRPRTIALLAEPQSDATLALELTAEMFPLAVCSSSATIGHSLSFGEGELATVIAQDASLADAAATAFCNMLQSPNDIAKMLHAAENMPGVLGAFAQCKGQVGLWGQMQLVILEG